MPIGCGDDMLIVCGGDMLPGGRDIIIAGLVGSPGVVNCGTRLPIFCCVGKTDADMPACCMVGIILPVADTTFCSVGKPDADLDAGAMADTVGGGAEATDMNAGAVADAAMPSCVAAKVWVGCVVMVVGKATGSTATLSRITGAAAVNSGCKVASAMAWESACMYGC